MKGGCHMKLKHLEYFVKIAELGSISQAAKLYYLKPNNLSVCMNDLENEFGCSLLVRSNKGVRLTSNGEIVLKWAKEVIASKNAIVNEFKRQKDDYSELKGNMSFFINSSINQDVYHGIFQQFILKHPQVKVQIEEGNSNFIIENVAKNPSSVGLGYFDQDMIDKVTVIPELDFLFKRNAKLVVLASKNSDFAKKYSTVSIKTLSKLPLIIYNTAMGTDSCFVELFSKYCELNIATQVSNAMLFHSLLSTGQYIGIAMESNSSILEDYIQIPIRDKMELYQCGICLKNEINTPLIKAVTAEILRFGKEEK